MKSDKNYLRNTNENKQLENIKESKYVFARIIRVLILFVHLKEHTRAFT